MSKQPLTQKMYCHDAAVNQSKQPCNGVGQADTGKV